MRLSFVCLLALCLMAAPFSAPPAAAQDAAAEDGIEAGIEGTIRAQIDAFLADDFARAFSYASPNIRTIFGTAENFGRMVTSGYPMVHRPADVKMEELRDVSGVLWQRVAIIDAEGRRHLLDYQMIQAEDGSWQINAVEYLRAEGLSA